MISLPGSRSNVPAFWVVCILLAILGVLLVALPTPNTVDYSCSANLPITVSEENPLVVSLETKGVFAKVRLAVHSDRPLRFDHGGQLYTVAPGVRDSGKRMAVAGSKDSEGWISTAVMSLNGQNGLVTISPAGDAAHISQITYDVLKYKHATTLSTLSPSQLKWVFVIGLFTIVFIVLVRNWKPAYAEWGGIVFSFGVLVLNEFLFAVAVLAFLSIMYALRKRVNNGSGAISRLFMYILTAVLFMVVFKYLKVHLFNFAGGLNGMSILMPLGVSYFVIRLIDIQLRWFRGQSLDYSWRQFIHYMVFPGTLLAGPIESIHDFYNKRIGIMGANDYAYGIGRIVIGLVKKLIIADVILFPALHGQGVAGMIGFNSGISANKIILDAAAIGGGEIVLFGLTGLCFAYIDFSAYTDIAIGVSRLMGHRIRENFNFPLLAPNIREFWQRWHMSLSEWSFRNAYFPLLIKTRNSFVPLYVTMLVIGMWHAPNLSWYTWAMHHATGMTVVALLPKLSMPEWLSKVLQPVRIAMTVSFVGLGFLFVYFNDYSLGLQLYIKAWVWLLTFGLL